ncbi:hypothetical protein KKF84_13275 [Myxococcota bacterium]|nr:hypothetical protein [Myxococcota bacterium]MBU1536290.1 hypothetical protein [Myxococcota bacterium]
MSWEPITQAEIKKEIKRGITQMTSAQRYLWNTIRVPVQKWQLSPWGDLGGGFWVVAILGQTVVWYNDIEEGFNRSLYSNTGVIDEYWCNQDELQRTVGHLLTKIKTGEESGDLLGPPEPVVTQNAPADAPN